MTARPGEEENPLLAAALGYAGRGWPVLPLTPREKAPLGTLVPHGLHDATTDHATIKQWWAAAPAANVGIRTGAISGLVVLDVDPRHGGDDALKELEQNHGKLPDTVIALTGGGGCHYLFAHPGPRVVVRNAVAVDGARGLDARGDGGYIVAPPSRHPRGRDYLWELSSHPDEVPIAVPPPWLLKLLCPTSSPGNDPTAGAAIPEGGRNTILASLAGAMRRQGMTPEAIRSALRAENAQRCQPPLPPTEVDRIAASVSRYEPAPSKPSRGASQATRLVELAAGAELFHTPEREAFATVAVDGHRETWSLKSTPFRLWLRSCYFGATGAAPNSQAIQDALGVLESRALFVGPELRVFVRLAWHDGAIYLDLANDRWEAVRITPRGWEIVTDPAVRFRRTKGMALLPHPVHGWALDALRPFVNVAREGDWVLVVAWLLAAVRPAGPYPILALHGEQGSAKSSMARALRALIDPNTSPLRAEPRDGRDVMIGAKNAWCLAYDNLSSLPGWLSDALCRLSTGGGFATRELYTDDEEVLFEAQRPVILNGIEEVASQGDLLDRMLVLDLPGIEEDQRRREDTFNQAFEAARPQILGALLDAVSGALRELPNVRLQTYPRMADFAAWAVAGMTALGWPPDIFRTAYAANRERSHDVALEASQLAAEVRALAGKGPWEGTASDLLRVLNEQADESVRRQRSWPASPRAASNTLRRLKPDLRAVGVLVEFRKEPGGRRRLISIRTVPPPSVPTVPTVPDNLPLFSGGPATAHSSTPPAHRPWDAWDERDDSEPPISSGGSAPQEP
jgi:hypothetical protein